MLCVVIVDCNDMLAHCAHHHHHHPIFPRAKTSLVWSCSAAKRFAHARNGVYCHRYIHSHCTYSWYTCCTYIGFCTRARFSCARACGFITAPHTKRNRKCLVRAHSTRQSTRPAFRMCNYAYARRTEHMAALLHALLSALIVFNNDLRKSSKDVGNTNCVSVYVDLWQFKTTRLHQ